MKQLILIIAITLIGFKGLKAQTTGVSDTLGYLKSIVANKAFYINKPFSILQDSLRINIKYFNQKTGIGYNLSKETSTSYGFFFPQSNEDFYLTYPRIEVFWKMPLDAVVSWSLYKTYAGGWSSAVANFYSTGIIADIKIRE